jgi:hypothetical protein
LAEVNVLEKLPDPGTRYSLLQSGGARISLQQTARAVVGGALASAFIAAALAHFIPDHIISDGLLTTGAAIAGGIVGKVYLIS